MEDGAFLDRYQVSVPGLISRIVFDPKRAGFVFLLVNQSICTCLLAVFFDIKDYGDIKGSGKFQSVFSVGLVIHAFDVAMSAKFLAVCTGAEVHMLDIQNPLEAVKLNVFVTFAASFD
jgi:hypothetical protein